MPKIVLEAVRIKRGFHMPDAKYRILPEYESIFEGDDDIFDSSLAINREEDYFDDWEPDWYDDQMEYPEFEEDAKFMVGKPIEPPSSFRIRDNALAHIKSITNESLGDLRVMRSFSGRGRCEYAMRFFKRLSIRAERRMNRNIIQEQCE